MVKHTETIQRLFLRHPFKFHPMKGKRVRPTNMSTVFIRDIYGDSNF